MEKTSDQIQLTKNELDANALFYIHSFKKTPSSLMKALVIGSILFLFLSACHSQKVISENNDYLRWVGDIAYSKEIDKTDFLVCNGDDEIVQYFNISDGPMYFGEKSSLVQTFNEKFEPIIDSTQNGLIRLRFIVNCKGEAGRYRILQSDTNYQEFTFDNRITDQLAQITKEIVKWQILYKDQTPADYYFYLVFKIKNGALNEILP